MIHASLEDGGGISQSKSHNLWYIGAEWSFESHFVGIIWFDEDIIVPCMNIKLGEQFLPFEFIELNLYIRHGVMIFNRDIV